jgi:hypothetical protein
MFEDVFVGHAFMLGSVRCLKETAYSYSHLTLGIRFYHVISNPKFFVQEIPW